MSSENPVIENLKTLLGGSVRIKMEQIRALLNISQYQFNEKILDWADEFGFEIDGAYINMNKNTINELIVHLDAQFKKWVQEEMVRAVKIRDFETQGIESSLEISKKIVALDPQGGWFF